MASPACAGSYSDPTFSGGYWTFDDDPNSYPFPQANPYAGDHEDANFCGGNLTATSTWTPASSTDTSPAPQVIVTQVADAYWAVRGVNGYPTASCADGFGDSEVDTTYMDGYYGGDSGRTNYSVQSPSGNTVTVTRSGVSATLDYNSTIPPVDDGDVGASWGVTVSPVTIEPEGATSDGNGGWDILVGQDCAPFLAGIPSSCTVSNYQWTVTGTTMQSWMVSSDSTHTTEADGSGKLNIESPGWFWNDPKQTSETITCTATVTPPTGQGNPFQVTATQTVGVYLPTLVAKALGGQMTIDANDPAAVTKGDFCLYASPAPTQPGGMTWQVDLAPPQNCPVTFEKGNIYLVQTITPSAGYIDSSNQQWEDIFQGQLGLDTSWPYGWQVTEDNPYQPDYVSGDSPEIDLTYLSAAYVSMMHSFEDYIMFQPYSSSGSGYVPLAYFKWSVNSGDTIPSTNNWADFQNPAGIVEPSGSPVNFTPSNGYPSWTQNSGNAPIPWKKF